jgi:hypothetical protein
VGAGVTVRNNIFATANPEPVVSADRSLSRSAATLQGNDYYSASRWTVRWGSRSYSSLAGWRAATGQEMLAGRPAGLAVNPRFARGWPTAADPAGFALARGSPLRNAELNLARLYGLPRWLVDYAGHRIDARRPALGAG